MVIGLAAASAASLAAAPIAAGAAASAIAAGLLMRTWSANGPATTAAEAEEAEIVGPLTTKGPQTEQVASDARQALDSSSSTLLHMVQRIANLRRGLAGAGAAGGSRYVPAPKAADASVDGEQGWQQQLMGSTDQQRPQGKSAGRTEAGARDSGAGARDDQQAWLLMRALVNVRRLTTLIRERDARIRELERRMEAPTPAALGGMPLSIAGLGTGANIVATAAATPGAPLPADDEAIATGAAANSATTALAKGEAQEAQQSKLRADAAVRVAAELRDELAARNAQVAHLKAELAAAMALVTDAEAGAQQTAWSMLQKEAAIQGLQQQLGAAKDAARRQAEAQADLLEQKEAIISSLLTKLESSAAALQLETSVSGQPVMPPGLAADYTARLASAAAEVAVMTETLKVLGDTAAAAQSEAAAARAALQEGSREAGVRAALLDAAIAELSAVRGGVADLLAQAEARGAAQLAEQEARMAALEGQLAVAEAGTVAAARQLEQEGSRSNDATAQVRSLQQALAEAHTVADRLRQQPEDEKSAHAAAMSAAQAATAAAERRATAAGRRLQAVESAAAIVQAEPSGAQQLVGLALLQAAAAGWGEWATELSAEVERTRATWQREVAELAAKHAAALDVAVKHRSHAERAAKRAEEAMAVEQARAVALEAAAAAASKKAELLSRDASAAQAALMGVREELGIAQQQRDAAAGERDKLRTALAAAESREQQFQLRIAEQASAAAAEAAARMLQPTGSSGTISSIQAMLAREQERSAALMAAATTASAAAAKAQEHLRSEANRAQQEAGRAQEQLSSVQLQYTAAAGEVKELQSKLAAAEELVQQLLQQSQEQATRAAEAEAQAASAKEAASSSLADLQTRLEEACMHSASLKATAASAAAAAAEHEGRLVRQAAAAAEDATTAQQLYAIAAEESSVLRDKLLTAESRLQQLEQQLAQQVAFAAEARAATVYTKDTANANAANVSRLEAKHEEAQALATSAAAQADAAAKREESLKRELSLAQAAAAEAQEQMRSMLQHRNAASDNSQQLQNALVAAQSREQELQQRVGELRAQVAAAAAEAACTKEAASRCANSLQSKVDEEQARAATLADQVAAMAQMQDQLKGDCLAAKQEAAKLRERLSTARARHKAAVLKIKGVQEKVSAAEELVQQLLQKVQEQAAWAAEAETEAASAKEAASSSLAALQTRLEEERSRSAAFEATAAEAEERLKREAAAAQGQASRVSSLEVRLDKERARSAALQANASAAADAAVKREEQLRQEAAAVQQQLRRQVREEALRAVSGAAEVDCTKEAVIRDLQAQIELERSRTAELIVGAEARLAEERAQSAALKAAAAEREEGLRQEVAAAKMAAIQVQQRGRATPRLPAGRGTAVVFVGKRGQERIAPSNRRPQASPPRKSLRAQWLDARRRRGDSQQVGHKDGLAKKAAQEQQGQSPEAQQEVARLRAALAAAEAEARQARDEADALAAGNLLSILDKQRPHRLRQTAAALLAPLPSPDSLPVELVASLLREFTQAAALQAQAKAANSKVVRLLGLIAATDAAIAKAAAQAAVLREVAARHEDLRPALARIQGVQDTTITAAAVMMAALPSPVLPRAGTFQLDESIGCAPVGAPGNLRVGRRVAHGPLAVAAAVDPVGDRTAHTQALLSRVLLGWEGPEPHLARLQVLSRKVGQLMAVVAERSMRLKDQRRVAAELGSLLVMGNGRHNI